MALEEALNENTAAMRELTARLAAAAVATPEKRPPGRPPGSTSKPKLTIAEVKAIAMKVVADKGKPAVLALMKKHGAAKLADMDESKYAAFIAAAEVLLNEEEPAEEAGEGDDEI